MSALLDLPRIEDQTTFNLKRWEELCADPELARFQGRIETDRHGQIIMNFPADFAHGVKQFNIGHYLRELPIGGVVSVECPISTSEGVKVADVAWASETRLKKISGRKALKRAPEICVEVISPSNTRGEIEEKRRLYFEAGAKEVWVCEKEGEMRFFLSAQPDADAGASLLCPGMPVRIDRETH